MLPFTSSDSFVSSNWSPTNTVLHRSKNFAVAPVRFRTIIPEGILPLSESASLFASLASRRTGVTRYPAARLLGPVSGLSSIPPRRDSGCLMQTGRVAYFGPFSRQKERRATAVRTCASFNQPQMARTASYFTEPRAADIQVTTLYSSGDAHSKNYEHRVPCG